MHGCGNDYVFIDGFTNPVPEDPGKLAMQVSDRHRGIGADGLVLMLPSFRSDAVACMRMFNADGSEGSLCGNALRCMAMWLHQSGRAERQFGIEMAERVIAARILESQTDRGTAVVSVMIGQPVVQNEAAAGRSVYLRAAGLEDIELPPLIRPPVHVSMGNPHTVLFVESLQTLDFHQLGPAIKNHPSFPNRTNVEFVELSAQSVSRGEAEVESRVRVRVWERGSGETLACGSGACAVAVAAIAVGLLPEHLPVVVAMRGGDLRIHWDEADRVHLEGPAVESFRGTVTPISF